MGIQRYHQTYREQIVEFMRERAVSIAVYVDGDYSKHVESMSKQGTWGTDAEIMVATTYFGLPIRVFYWAGQSRNGIRMNLSFHFSFLWMYLLTV